MPRPQSHEPAPENRIHAIAITRFRGRVADPAVDCLNNGGAMEYAASSLLSPEAATCSASGGAWVDAGVALAWPAASQSGRDSAPIRRATPLSTGSSRRLISWPT
jgi:hypothetical protein